MKNVKIKSMIIAVLSIMIFSGCHSNILEYEDTVFEDIKMIQEDTTHYLYLKGYIMHSSLSVDSLNTYQIDNDKVIEISLTLIHSENKDGNFIYKIEVGEDINRVLFGKNKYIVWDRN